jgi:hypothetical protein
MIPSHEAPGRLDAAGGSAAGGRAARRDAGPALREALEEVAAGHPAVLRRSDGRVCRLQIVPAKLHHGEDLASRLRPEDYAALRRLTGTDPGLALSEGIVSSAWARAVMIDDRPEAVFGVRRMTSIGVTGSPWLLASPAVQGFPRAALYVGRHAIAEMLIVCPRLVQIVDAYDEPALRFLHALRFRLSRVRRLPNGAAVVFVEKEAPLV